jgi:hypothetical protein
MESEDRRTIERRAVRPRRPCDNSEIIVRLLETVTESLANYVVLRKNFWIDNINKYEQEERRSRIFFATDILKPLARCELVDLRELKKLCKTLTTVIEPHSNLETIQEDDEV